MPTKTPLPRILSAAAVLTLALSMTARLLLRNLALFLYLAAEEQFAAIFSQLRTADIRMPILLLYALSLAYCFPAAKLKRWSAILIGLPVLLIMLTFALYASSVNGILFGDVLLSLADVIGKGGFEGM